MDILTENRSVVMHRPTLAGLPVHALPADLSPRWYLPGDERHWIAIHQDAEKILKITLETFEQQFGHDPNPLGQRMCFLVDPAGTPIATASAWYDDHFNDPAYGRIHWVSMVQRLQGRGIAKGLLSIVCQRLVDLGHQRAYLFTSTARVPAINLYLSFGFLPLYRDKDDRAAWNALRPLLKYAW